MCDHEVTQAEYKAVMGVVPPQTPFSKTYDIGDNKPVSNTSWYDAIAYCNKLSVSEGLSPCYKVNGNINVSRWGYTPHSQNGISGTITCDFAADGYRLPTEAEWEYAARGGNKSKDYKYSGSNNIGDVAWYSGNSNKINHDVKTKLPNELGLYDMSGNELEWCWDIAGDYSNNPQINPTGLSHGYNRSIRGGNYYDKADECTVFYRVSDSRPGYDGGRPWDTLWGFRVVRSAQ